MTNLNDHELTDADLDGVCGGRDGLRTNAELSMLGLQSLVQQRSVMLQVTTDVMSSMGSSQAAIASNIGH